MSRLLSIVFAIASVAAGSALAGPLSPPAGGLNSSYKTLSEVEPRIAISASTTPGDSTCTFLINAAGSYYLTGNLFGSANKHGIKITASRVTIDLNGFRIQGGTGTTSGITVQGTNLDNITVENGSLNSWLGHGVDLVGGSANPIRSVVRNIHSDNNVGAGIRVYNASRVEHCSADWNGGIGFDIFGDCTLVECHASFNVGNGFDTSSRNVLVRCIAESNSGRGISSGSDCLIDSCRASGNSLGGVSTGSGCSIRSCVASGNTSYGISAFGACLVLNNVCSQSLNGSDGTASGIRLNSADNRVEGNVCTANPIGVDARSAGNLIIRNSCTSNTTNWVFVAGNAYGPIVNTPAGAAVNGSSAASSLSTTDANANFSY